MTPARAVATAALLLAGCESVQMPGFLKGQDATPAASSGDVGADAKKITKLAPKASVMLEKNCPTIVQPYTLEGTTRSWFDFGAGQLLDKGAATLGMGGRGASAQGSQTLAAAKKAAMQLNWLPMEVEVLYGQRSHAQETDLLERDSKLGKRYYPAADRMLQEVLAQVGQTHNYQFKLFIRTTSEHNALSRPGGFLYLDQGLLEDAATQPKAYFAVAHEVAHVLQRHETMELQSIIIDSFSIKEDLHKAMGSATANPEALLAHVKIGKDQFIRHHIDQELQADSCAARMLSRVFGDSQALVGSLNAFLKELPKSSVKPPARRSTVAAERIVTTMEDVVTQPIKVHPTSAEREQNLRAMYAEVSGTSVSSTR